ncbi:MAG: fimbrial protein [Enterobacterales bacterium]|uniref:fimbrial protein n=1 Tax=Serratia sp. (in: enterobacteria) TaxID=616 RepID=UPI003F3A6CEF
MFKKSVLQVLMVSSLLVGASVSSAETLVASGTINFTGKVVDAGCAVAAGSIDQSIEMGQVRTTALAALGDTSNATDVTIALEDCDTTVAATAAVIFSGTSPAGDTTVLAAGRGSAAAQNVGIKFYDNQNAEIDLGVASSAVDLANGDNTLHFFAKYYALGAATAGDASATSTFTMVYP